MMATAVKTTRREYNKERIEQIGIRLSESERSMIERLALAKGLSISQYIRELIKQKLGG